MGRLIRASCAALLAAVILLGASGCGNGDITWQEAYSYDLDECVRLGQYKGLEVEVDERYATQADIDARIAEILDVYSTYALAEDYAAQMGDRVIIDYVGTIREKAFEGGSATDASVELGSANFIEGFEEGLVGAKAGDELELDLTFPADYMRTSLAGRDAKFAVKVKAVYKKSVPEFNDAFALANSEYSSAADYLQAITDEINAEKPQQVEQKKLEDCWNAAKENALVFYVPQDDMQNYYYSNYYYYYAMARHQDMEMDEFLDKYMGVTEKDFDAMINKLALSQEEEVVVAMAIARDENLVITKDMYNAKVEEYAKDWGYEDSAAFKKDVGQKVDEYYSPIMIYRDVFLDMVMQLVADSAVEIPLRG